MVNEQAMQAVLREMKSYRPDRDETFIRRMITEWVEKPYEPMAETSQDIIWSYQRNLEKVKHAQENSQVSF